MMLKSNYIFIIIIYYYYYYYYYYWTKNLISFIILIGLIKKTLNSFGNQKAIEEAQLYIDEIKVY